MERVAPLLQVFRCDGEVELVVVKCVDQRLVRCFARFISLNRRLGVVLMRLVLLIVIVVGTLCKQREYRLDGRNDGELVALRRSSMDSNHLDDEIENVPEAAYSHTLAAELGDELVHLLEHRRVILRVVDRDSEYLKRMYQQSVCI